MDWLFTSTAGVVVAALLISIGVLALAALIVWRYGGVTMGPDPEIPRVIEPDRFLVRSHRWVAPNYVPTEEQQVFIEDETTAAVIDLTETVELHPIDPLAKTTELEVLDPSVPLFYAIKRPKPYVAESFTQGIERAQIERALAAGEPK